MKGDPFAAARNAVSNASSRPVGDGEIAAALASGDGAGHVVRALFGDCAAETLLVMAHSQGLSPAQLTTAYLTARTKHAAANETLDAIGEGAFD